VANLPLKLVKKLYYKEKLSAIEVAERLGVTTDIALRFMKKNNLPRRTLVEANNIIFERKSKSFSLKEDLSKKDENLKVASIMLYWGEGDSKIENSDVRFSNTDPRMVRIFSNFLRYICQVPKEKIRVMMILYPDLNEKICMEFWSKASCIPSGQFYKTQVIHGRHPTRRLSYGVCMIGIVSREVKEKIFVWINLYQKELKSMRE